MKRSQQPSLAPANRLCLYLGVLMAVVTPAFAAGSQESPRSVERVIKEYVGEALSSNLALRAAVLEVEKSAAALDAARARFFPEAALALRYTRAEGGREVSLPLAAAFNPLYSTLNELLLAQNQEPRFGQIEDPRFLLQREREQDSRLSVRQPLYAPAVPAAVRAQRARLESAEYAQLALRERLRRDVTVGYLDWLRAMRAVAIVESSGKLLAENERIVAALFRNGKLTEEQVLRARAERLAVEQQGLATQNLAARARGYVNFLRNRPLDDALEMTEIEAGLARLSADLTELRQMALKGRAELGEVDSFLEAASAQRDLAEAARKPVLALGLDGGSQGERYEFGRGRNFATVSLLLNWTLFDGGARRAEARSARLTERQLQLQRDSLVQQVQLEVEQALDQLKATEASLASATARAAAARAALRIAARKRDEGVISQVEFLDAQTSASAAELNLNATRFELLARQAELDYVVGAPDPIVSGNRP